MPLVKQTLSLAAGATSAAVLTGTTYEYVGPNVGIRVAAATDQAPAAEGSNVVMNFTMNNTELTKNGAVSQLTAGDAFGHTGNYILNDAVRLRTVYGIGQLSPLPITRVQQL